MDFHSAYILHRYPYRETSFLLKTFTAKEGLITLVARHAKRPKSDWYSLLQPFQKIKIVYQGNGNVLTLTRAERDGATPIFLSGKTLFAGFYLNELLLKFLTPHDDSTVIFRAYDATLLSLHQAPEQLETTLRYFELKLFETLGLLPDFRLDTQGDAIHPQAWYQLEQHHQPRRLDQAPHPSPYHFQGFELIALREGNLNENLLLRAAKRFTRLWLEFYGIGKNLQSREIFAEVFKEQG